MRQLDGGTKVKGGFYWNKGTWEIDVVNGKGGRLPAEGTFVRVPAPVLFVAAPLLGGLYVLFLPFIGFALLAQFAYRKVASAGRSVRSEVGAALSPGLAAGAVAFTPSQDDETAPGAEKAGKADPLEALKQELKDELDRGEPRQ